MAGVMYPFSHSGSLASLETPLLLDSDSSAASGGALTPSRREHRDHLEPGIDGVPLRRCATTVGDAYNVIHGAVPPDSPAIDDSYSTRLQALAAEDLSAVQRCLRRHLEDLVDSGFVYGEMWTPNDGMASLSRVDGVMRPNTGAGDDVEKLQAFAKLPSEKNITLSPGVGLAGRAWQEGETEWNVLDQVFDDPENPSTPLDAPARELFHTSCAIPIFAMTAGGIRQRPQRPQRPPPRPPRARSGTVPSESAAAAVQSEMAAASSLLQHRHGGRASIGNVAQSMVLTRRRSTLMLTDTRELIAVFVVYTRREQRVDSDVPGMKGPLFDAYLKAALKVVQWDLRKCGAKGALARHRMVVVHHGWRKLQEHFRAGGLKALAAKEGEMMRLGVEDSQAGMQPYDRRWLMAVINDPWAYFKKWRGAKGHPAKALDDRHCVLATVEVFLSFMILTLLQTYAFSDSPDSFHLIGPFGAMAVLYFVAPASPFGQPRILFLSTLFALTVSIVFSFITDVGKSGHPWHYPILPFWLGATLCMTVSVVGMAKIGITCPPAASTPIAFLQAAPAVHRGTFWFFVSPFLIGWIVLLGVALLMNNLSPRRKWPLFW
ncbi:unnamed protein product [Vitrella brassicaformis CCMP3155]|uniref:HPP transmembrane region domain-containing protein n=2 Tax=Vitrella brassicaformis TaxID=1169539 RepID=A0A0G4EIY4_VITBC|nr:unnamed protein product [Vitrella brassicaformis CCMP3155]|eukprot:CEL96976.1 unnamed protein product [Vitrella brassicaformis CCMP3155]